MDYMKAKFSNKEVQIYPGDSYKKFGIVRDISDAGVVFEVTKSDDGDAWPVGSLMFKAYSANLTFALI